MNCSNIHSFFSSTATSCHARFVQAKESVGLKAAHLKETVISKGTSLKKTLKEDEGIIRFIRLNWPKLIAYAIAWAAIVSGVGLLYGFNATAIPLAIGIGCGIAFGILTGIGTVCVLDRKNNKNEGNNTLWSLLNKGFNSLDPNGTRAILVSVSVTVVLAATVVFPYALGAAFGVIIGNHLATKIGYNVKVSLEDKNASSPKVSREGLNLGAKQTTDFNQRLKEAEATFKRLKEEYETSEKLKATTSQAYS